MSFVEQGFAQETAYKARSTRDENAHQSVGLETKGTRGDGAEIKLIHVTPGKFRCSTIIYGNNYLRAATDMLNLDVFFFDREVSLLAQLHHSVDNPAIFPSA